MGDHSGRKTMAFVADWALAHDGKIAANLSAAVNLTSPLDVLQILLKFLFSQA